MFGQLSVLLSAHFIFVHCCQARVFFFLSLQSFIVSHFLLGEKKKDTNYFLEVEQWCSQAYNLILIFVLFPLLVGDSQGCLNIYSPLLAAFLM